MDQLEVKVLEIIAQQKRVPVESVTINLSFEELGLDSLDAVEDLLARGGLARAGARPELVHEAREPGDLLLLALVGLGLVRERLGLLPPVVAVLHVVDLAVVPLELEPAWSPERSMSEQPAIHATQASAALESETNERAGRGTLASYPARGFVATNPRVSALQGA